VVELEMEAVVSERLRRQGLSRPADAPQAYLELFRRLQPVAPVHFSYPGSPPRLVNRTRLDDAAEANRLRARRSVVKGRFARARIAYVLAEDLGLYAAAFRRPMVQLNATQAHVLEVVRGAGGITPRQIKEETRLGGSEGLLNKQIMPALHRLQSAFLVFEDQVDSDWERGWYAFEAEWPETDVDAVPWEDAAAEVLERTVCAQVFATLEQLGDWSGFRRRALRDVVADLEAEGRLVGACADGLGEGWVCAGDVKLEDEDVPVSAIMLHKADPLARFHESELKRRFGGVEVLQYLLIDGRFRGAVAGHWRIGPHDVEDVIVELPRAEATARREEILAAVSKEYTPPNSRILQYNGAVVRARP